MKRRLHYCEGPLLPYISRKPNRAVTLAGRTSTDILPGVERYEGRKRLQARHVRTKDGVNQREDVMTWTLAKQKVR
jgi:hypothetical protein